ncbi:MAG: hypothetical protein ACKVVT_16805 [Dehalococcoidia bacterium]
MTAGKAVLLSCPVHKEYTPGPGLSRTISVRVRLDLVIPADRGGQRFKRPDVEEIVLPIWFDHFATHDPQVWKDHDLLARTA